MIRLARTWALAFAGPVLIVAGVLVVLHSIAFGGHVSQQHPDLLAEWLPSFCFLGKSIASGHVPVWNPHVMGGVPFAADPQSGWGYLPAIALFALMPCARAIRWFIVLQPILAGLGVMWFLRSEGLSRVAATVGGLTLALGLAGSKAVLEIPFAGATAWTALTLAAASRLLHARTWQARLGWTAATAVAWGQIAGAHPSHGLVMGTAALLAYLVARGFAESRSGRRRDVLVVAALVIAGLPLVNLAILLPRLSYVPHTTLGWGYSRLAEMSYRLGAMPRPQLAAGPALAPSWPLGFSYSPGLYLGGAALMLALAGWRSARSRALFAGFALYGGIFYVLSLRPVADWLAPRVGSTGWGGFYVHAPSRLLYAVVLATSICAGLGVEAWRSSRTWGQRAAAVLPGIVVWGLLPPLLGVTWTSLRLLAAGMAAAAAVLGSALRRPKLLALLPVVLAAELVANGLLGQHRAYPAPPTLPKGFVPRLEAPAVTVAPYVRSEPISRAIRSAGPGRFVSILPPAVAGQRLHGQPRPTLRGGFLGYQEPRYWPFMGNQRATLLGLEDTAGYNPVQLPRYWTFVRTLERKPLRYNASFLRSVGPAALQVLQVRWVIQGAGATPPPGSTLAAKDGSAELYAIPHPSPRASVYTSWRVVHDATAALRAVSAASPGTLDRQVVLEASPAASSGPPVPSTPASFRWTSPSSATVDVDTPRASVLVIRNSYERHWHANIDGRRAAVIPADGLDQGVPVPAGHHVVRLLYDDPSIGLGLLASALSLSALLGTAAALWWLRRRRTRTA